MTTMEGLVDQSGTGVMDSNNESDDFIKEDGDVPGADEEDEVDQLIAVEHGKYQERRELWREQLRASRPWSAPALGSPRPETQRKRDRERAEGAALDGDAVSMSGREEYVPPSREHLPTDDATLSYMRPARSQSAGSVRSSTTLPRGSLLATSGMNGLQNILEDAPLEQPAGTADEDALKSSAADDDIGPAAMSTDEDGTDSAPAGAAPDTGGVDDQPAIAAVPSAVDDDDDGIEEVTDDEGLDGSDDAAGVPMGQEASGTTAASEARSEQDAAQDGEGRYSGDAFETAPPEEAGGSPGKPDASSSSSRAESEAGFTAMSDSTAAAPTMASTLSDYGVLPHPHTFAVALLDRDTNPAVSNDSKAEVKAAATTQRPPSAKRSLPFYGYLGFLAPLQEGAAAAQAPAVTGAAAAATALAVSRSRPTSAPQRSQSAPRVSGARSRPVSAMVGRDAPLSAAAAEGPLTSSTTLRGSHSLRKSSPVGFEAETGSAWADDRRPTWPSMRASLATNARARPASARPAYSRAGGDPSPPRNTLLRPASAHSPLHPVNEAAWVTSPQRPPAWLARPTSATPSYGASTYGMASGADGRPLSATAAVAVGGQTVSVYVADTMRRIVDANRCLATLGLSRRYRLKTILSNMELEMYDSLAGPGMYDPEADVAPAPTIRALTLKQFLSSHWRLRQQVGQHKKLSATAVSAQWAYNGVVTASPPPVPSSAARPPSGGRSPAANGPPQGPGSAAGGAGHTSWACKRTSPADTPPQLQHSSCPSSELEVPTARPVPPALVDQLYKEAAAIAPSEAGDAPPVFEGEGGHEVEEAEEEEEEEVYEDEFEQAASSVPPSVAQTASRPLVQGSEVVSAYGKANRSSRSSEMSHQASLQDDKLPAIAASSRPSGRPSTVASASVSGSHTRDSSIQRSASKRSERVSAVSHATSRDEDGGSSGTDAGDEEDASGGQSSLAGSESAELAAQAAMLRSSVASSTS